MAAGVGSAVASAAAALVGPVSFSGSAASLGRARSKQDDPMSLSDGFEHDVQQLWHSFLQRVEPLRPDLHRYCRALTRSVWDAEDLLQETLLRAFSKLGDLAAGVDNPKAYLLRIASNLWIDQVRKAQHLLNAVELDVDAAADPQQAIAIRDAARRLLQRLSPQERAAVVLKEVFDLQLAEIAAILETTVGAIKSALHDGRRKLAAPDPASSHQRANEHLVDTFVELFNARDLQRLAQLLRTDVKGEVLGMGSWQGATDVLDFPLYYSMHLEHGEPRAERQRFAGEPIAIIWYAEPGAARMLRNVVRFESDAMHITRLQFFTLCPQTLRDIATTLGVPVKDNGYGPWSPAFLSMRKQPEYLAWVAQRSAQASR
jgi:RNA polymerase sigma-70 factor, ECF subfamily